MAQLAGILKTLGVLVGIWAVLAGAAWITGAIPEGTLDSLWTSREQIALGRELGTAGKPPNSAASSPSGTEGRAQAKKTDPAAKDGPRVGGEPRSAGETGKAQGQAAPRAPAKPPESRAATRYVACAATAEPPTLTAIDAASGPTPELAVGCGGVLHLFGFVRSPAGDLLPLRSAIFDAAGDSAATATSRATGTTAAPEDPSLARTVVAAGDVDDDGVTDLVIGVMTRVTSSVRSGSLHLVRGSASGAFEPARRLAPIGASDVAIADLDGKRGLEIIALNRGNTFARRPSELWIYRGGPTPVRSAVLRLGLGGEELVVGDVDGDGMTDLAAVATTEPRVDVFFGDAAGRFARRGAVTVADARELAAGDYDRDGTLDLLVLGKETLEVGASSEASLVATLVPLPPALGSLRYVNVDADDRKEAFALSKGELVQIVETSGHHAKAPFVQIAGFGITRYALGDFDGDGSIDVAVIGRASLDGAPWELLILPAVTKPISVTLTDKPIAMQDAPLLMRIDAGG